MKRSDFTRLSHAQSFMNKPTTYKASPPFFLALLPGSDFTPLFGPSTFAFFRDRAVDPVAVDFLRVPWVDFLLGAAAAAFCENPAAVLLKPCRTLNCFCGTVVVVRSASCSLRNKRKLATDFVNLLQAKQLNLILFVFCIFHDIVFHN